MAEGQTRACEGGGPCTAVRDLEPAGLFVSVTWVSTLITFPSGKVTAQQPDCWLRAGYQAWVCLCPLFTLSKTRGAIPKNWTSNLRQESIDPDPGPLSTHCGHRRCSSNGVENRLSEHRQQVCWGMGPVHPSECSSHPLSSRWT